MGSSENDLLKKVNPTLSRLTTLFLPDKAIKQIKNEKTTKQRIEIKN